MNLEAQTYSNRPEFSILIPTRNRSDLLAGLLDSITSLDKAIISSELVVINNGSSDNTAELLARKSEERLVYLEEKRVGSSAPRNTGVKHALGEWLIFLDDDTRVPPNFLIKAKEIIDSKQFDCFGGMYYPWYPYGKPNWLPDTFGQKEMIRASTGPIYPVEDGFLSGGIMAVKREVFLAVGGFNTELGMRQKIGYGEENEFQLRLLQHGYTIGFVPDWYIEHAVLPHKFSVRWHLQSVFSRGRDTQRLHNDRLLLVIIAKLLQVLVTASIVRVPRSLMRILFDSNFYWQNAILHTLDPICRWSGRLIGWWQSRTKEV